MFELHVPRIGVNSVVAELEGKAPLFLGLSGHERAHPTHVHNSMENGVPTSSSEDERAHLSSDSIDFSLFRVVLVGVDTKGSSSSSSPCEC